MTVTLPTNARGPILELELPSSEAAVDILLRNRTTEKTLTVSLPAGWNGDDLTLDFYRQTIKDQTGADRSALLSAEDHALWLLEPLLSGANNVEITALSGVKSSTKSPGTVAAAAVTSGLGEADWGNPNNVKASDNSRAVAETAGPNSHTYFIKGTNYGFSIPSGALIVAIRPAAEGSASVANEVTDYLANMIKGGVLLPSNAAADGTWPTSEVSRLYGDTRYLAGTTWAYTDINSSNFGFALSAKFGPLANAVSIDHLPITVYYAEATSYAAKATLTWEKAYN